MGLTCIRKLSKGIFVEKQAIFVEERELHLEIGHVSLTLFQISHSELPCHILRFIDSALLYTQLIKTYINGIFSSLLF
jgi:hypothetical protein